MSRKRHPEHVNHERWLVSYADFITLLFAFFVVLFASGQSDKAKQRKISAAISSAFTQMAIFDPHSVTPALDKNSGAGATATPNPVELPMATAATGDAPHQPDAIPSGKLNTDPLTPELLRERVQQIIQKQLASGGVHKGDLILRPTPEGLTLSLQEGGFFDSGSAELRSAAIPTLTAIAASLPATAIRIEGHTDNLPMHSALYVSNWELSSARASAITRFLLEHSTANPAQLSAAGYAEFHPVASNATSEGRARNRRVDIVFLQPQQDATSSRPSPSR
jgi:chemotaxis protein MotB